MKIVSSKYVALSSFTTLTLLMSGSLAAQTLEGTVAVTDNDSLGEGAVTLANNTTIEVRADGLVLDNDITINGVGNIDTGINTVTLSGSITDGTIETLNFVGQWRVDDGPSFSDLPAALTGQEVAALLFGGEPGDYQISTAGPLVEDVNRRAWVSVYGAADFSDCPGYPCGREVADDIVTSTNISNSGRRYLTPGDESAYVRDWAIGPQFTNYAFGAVLTPAAAELHKFGAGTLILSGISTYTGGTFVHGGELRIIGSIGNSLVTVNSGATLSGTGVVGGLVATAGSFVAPGVNGGGVLGVNGTINLLTGSTTQLQVSANGPSDMILGNGVANLGGTVAFTNLGGNYAFNSSILLLEATGGRTGVFDATTGLESFGIMYRPELVYTNNQVFLQMTPNQLRNIIGNGPLTANQLSVLNRIDAAVLAGFDPQALFGVYGLPGGALQNALDQLSGEVYATSAGVGIEQERLVREAVLGRISGVSSASRDETEAGNRFGVWGHLLGGWGNGAGDGNSSRFEADRMGFVTGIDFGRANDDGGWRAGVFGLQIQTDVTVSRLSSRSEVQQAGAGIYAAIDHNGFGAALGGYVTDIDMRSSREIALPGLANSLVGATQGSGRQAFAEVSYSIEAGKSLIRPFVSAAVGRFKLEEFRETGGSAALAVAGQSYSTGSVSAGVDGSAVIAKRLRLGGTVAGRAQVGDRDPQAQIALSEAPQQAFGISGVQLDEVALAARLDATLELAKDLSVEVGYTGLIGSTVTDHGARAAVSLQF